MAISVSIVEDDGPTRSLLADMLRVSPGFNLAGDWGDAQTATQFLPQLKPDVVLVDIQLRTSNGISLIKQLKPVMPETQFLVLSVCKDVAVIYDALASGATGYLLKDTPRNEILSGIREVYEGGSPISGEIARKVIQFFLQPAPAHCEKLSAREDEILQLMARGLFFKEVAERLNITVPTVKTHVRRIYVKLHVQSRTQAVAKYSELGHATAPPKSSESVNVRSTS